MYCQWTRPSADSGAGYVKQFFFKFGSEEELFAAIKEDKKFHHAYE